MKIVHNTPAKALKWPFLFILFLFLAGCRTGPGIEDDPVPPGASPEEPPGEAETLVPEQVPAPALSGMAVSVSRYGNVLTDITGESLENRGLEPGDVLHLRAGEFEGDLPFVITYSDVSRGSPLLLLSGGVVELAISYGNFSEKNSVVPETPLTLSLVKKGGYRAELEIMALKKSENRRDYSSDAVFANFREVKMGGIPAGLLYRSCHPAMGDARAPYAARLAEQVRIATVINLADSREELAEKAALIPWYQNFINRNSIIPLAMGVDVSSADFAAKLKTGLQFMLTRTGPYLIHCNEGKDRAGYTAALLEAFMGASVEEIIEDYMISYVNYFGFVPGEERYRVVSQIMVDILQEMNGGRPLTGSPREAAENCLRARIGLNEGEIAALREKLSGH